MFMWHRNLVHISYHIPAFQEGGKLNISKVELSRPPYISAILLLFSSKFQKLKMVFPRRKEQIIIPGIFCFFFGVHSEPKNFESYWKHCSSFFKD